MQKETVIVPPNGYEVDKENSTFERIVFKEIPEKKKRITTPIRGLDGEEVRVNEGWAFSIKINSYGAGSNCDREYLIYLTDCLGTWKDAEGNVIRGALFYEPKI